MPPPASPEFRARALALAAQIGPDAAAERLTRGGEAVTGRAIRKWAAQGTATPAGRSAVQPRSAPGPGRAPPDPDAEAAGGDLPPELQGLDPEAMDFAALEELSRDVVAYRRQAKKDDAVRTYVALARLEMEVRVALHKVRPPAKVDPDSDPANVEAAELLLVRLAALVGEAEAPAPEAPAPPPPVSSSGEKTQEDRAA